MCFLAGRGQRRIWRKNSLIRTLHWTCQEIFIYLQKLYLTSRRTEVHVLLPNAGDTEEIQACLESAALIYFKSYHRSYAVTLLIARIIHGRVGRAHINPVILMYPCKHINLDVSFGNQFQVTCKVLSSIPVKQMCICLGLFSVFLYHCKSGLMQIKLFCFTVA